MSGITITEKIAAPADLVFQRSTDIAAWPDFISSITGVKLLTDGPVGVGTKFVETRMMYGREASEQMEVTEFDPPHGYTLEAENHGAHYYSRFRFQTDGTGTAVTLSFDAQPLTLMAKLL
ncbi:MAG: SRPBCC family protein, partial [Pirellulales bacterium]|nr:SRPBCC family protein [Pirellulales bacterium]